MPRAFALTLAALFVTGCATTSSDADSTPDAGRDAEVDRDAEVGRDAEGSRDAEGGGDGGSELAVHVRPNEALDNHPHRFDVYAPSNATSVLIALHGGGGSKEGFAYGLGIKRDKEDASWDLAPGAEAWLIDHQVAMVFPQGQFVVGYPNAKTWDNYLMNSGTDDVAFLQALSAHLRADPALPEVSVVYLAGHSNGGVMANRFWCESPATFEGYAALAGPPARALGPNGGGHPCAPTALRPYLGIVGDSDRVLRTAGNLDEDLWQVTPLLTQQDAVWADTWLLNDLQFHATRAALVCGDSPGAPQVSGQLTRWLDCGGRVGAILIAQASDPLGEPRGGDHCVKDVNPPCRTDLPGDTGLDLKTAIIEFMHAQPSEAQSTP